MTTTVTAGESTAPAKTPEQIAADEQKHQAALEEIIAVYPKNDPTHLITAMQMMQEKIGFLPAKLLVSLSRHLGISSAKVFGVATFYEQFRLTPPGETTIRVCHGTACHVKGADNITKALEKALGIKNGETTPDGRYTLEGVACLGACGLAPVMTIGGVAHGRLIAETAVEILEDHRTEKGGEKNG